MNQGLGMCIRLDRVRTGLRFSYVEGQDWQLCRGLGLGSGLIWVRVGLGLG